MHMTESALPEQAANAIAIVPGVARATPIVYAPTMLERGERRTLVYLIGEDRSAQTLPLVSGRRAGAGEIVVDEALGADRRAARDDLTSLGRRFRVVGEIAGTASLASSIALAERADLSPGCCAARRPELRPRACARGSRGRAARSEDRAAGAGRDRLDTGGGLAARSAGSSATCRPTSCAR